LHLALVSKSRFLIKFTKQYYGIKFVWGNLRVAQGVKMTNQQKTRFLLILILIIALILSGCRGSSAETDHTPTPFFELMDEEGDPFIGVPNPASFYCQEMGYDLELKETAGGTQGICTFPDGSKCDEWDFLAGKCGTAFSFCQRLGYTIIPGDTIGTCEFPDGSSCPEYEMFIRECEPPK
jgi:putative hemolysin